MIKDLAFVAYSVRDVPRAVAFYRDTIGLTPGDAWGEDWVEFNVGTTAFGVGKGEGLGIEPGKGFSAAFEVDDVAAMQAQLKDAGVEVGDVGESPVCWTCFVTDPEGNKFALHQRKA
jgi:predicted enzyme related to lactoylglutathione lyase